MLICIFIMVSKWHKGQKIREARCAFRKISEYLSIFIFFIVLFVIKTVQIKSSYSGRYSTNSVRVRILPGAYIFQN